METRAMLAAMLTENTGRHMLDSGGAYGRNWERNQGRDFESERETVLSVRCGYLEVTHNVYAWLAERVDYCEELDALFHGAYLEQEDFDGDRGWLDLMDGFPRWLSDRDGEERGGIYGDGRPFMENTYNREDLLSQTLQYLYWTDPDYGACILLQIHGGCDVRGGYTAPRAFTVGSQYGDDTAIFDNARAAIRCEPRPKPDPGPMLPGMPELADEGQHYWQTDDTCHWYRDGACGRDAGTQLEAYDMRELTDDETADDVWEPGVLLIDKAENVAYCPVCGGTLHASAY